MSIHMYIYHICIDRRIADAAPDGVALLMPPRAEEHLGKGLGFRI